ncbi:ATP-dependent RNA helicase DHX29-like [Sinocyclocheilus grahami]|uniref:ATP-dependent RNA helicase DHX29-like n=1 Tax=Sinocyclocheilus grahami TaxID=75366 RepID=UPI0007AD50DB|nr:PREDICTED: ATP-dependent RNA helicase DHX29-like [Sinocyclocheilus grahami]
MGGKKKRSAAAPASVQPAAAAAENATNAAATESAGNKLQQRPNNDKSTMKENKPRAPKTYSLNTNAQTDTSSVSDKSILKVVIQPELEKKVIKLINEYRQEHADKGPISGRLTSKKLLDLYTALQKFQFKTEHIEEAMKSSMLYGGDLTSALDWLCLNLRDDELPEGFSQKMQEEKLKSRPKFQPPKEDEKQTVTKKEASKEEDKPKAKTSVKDNGGSMKEWILRYAEQSEDQSSEEDENKDASVFNPELDEKFDPNDRYLLLAAQLYDAKEMAAESKAKKDKAGQRTAQDRIRVIQQEMKSLESHPVFNSAVKVKDAPKEEKKPVALTDGKEELNFNLFEQADTPPAEKAEKKKKEPKDIRNFDYTSRSWTGKSPKQFLIDWCRKNLPKSPPPSFGKVAVDRYWKCKVRIQRPNDVLEVCPTILTEDGMQAQHLGATLALYNLVKGQSVHQLLPPTYRDVWLEWQDGDQKEEEQTRSAINKPRDQFIARLLARLKQQQTLQPQAEPQERLQDAEAEDSWENLDMQEDHEPQRGGGLEAEEASRRLLLKLRSSALARRLLAEREQLPVFQHRQQVLEALRRHRVLVIAGETGSGKSTQIPQFILEELLANGEAAQPCNVVVTQPRRISAMSLASRVSQELGSEDGPGAKGVGRLQMSGYKLIALHSTLSSQDQSSAFTVPPPGVRKIVLSTNIAETGVTIPDVVFLIDTGKTKENRYHESSQMNSLVETFVSKASALQRQGRAGRVQEGFCFRLYPKFRFESFIDYSIPEILRVPLEELCLHIMKCEYGSPEDFLCRALDAPQQQAVCNAVSLLRKIGACKQDSYALTPLGHHLAALPVNVKIGKMLIFGAIFSCLETIATIAAAMSEKSPFVTPMSRKEEANLAKSALAVANSDHMTIYSAYLGWKSSRSEGMRAEMAYCRRHFLSRTALMTIEKCEYGSPEDFLCRALDAPQQQAVCNAVSLLRKIGACQQDSYALTPLGHHLAALPVNVKIGKMLIFGAIFSCLETIATIAAAMSEKSPFVTPMSRKEEANLAKSALAVANSDHMTIYSAYLGWKSSRSEGMRAEMAYCRRHFLSRTALMTIEVTSSYSS